VKRIHFLVDIRRHRGDCNFIIGLINRFMAGLPVVAVEWLVRADQAALVPTQSVIGQSDSNDQSWAIGIATRIRQLSQPGQEDLEFLVLSYDGYLLNSAERLVYSDNLRVRTKHLGELMKNSWTLQQTGGPVSGVPGMPAPPVHPIADRRAAMPSSGQATIPLDEAVALMKTLLRRGGYVSRGRAVPQKDVRGYLAAMDPRAAKVHGDPESESLVRNLVARGRLEGWLMRFDRTIGKSGTEMLYLEENSQVNTSPTCQPQQPIEGESSKPESPEGCSHPVDRTEQVVSTATPDPRAEQPAPKTEPPKKRTKENLPERTALMELAIQDDTIGSLTETREYFLDAIESILKDKGDEVLDVSHLFSRAENMAKKRAEENGYVAEAKWGIAKSCIQRLAVRSGALMTERDGEKVCILEGLGDESSPVCDVSPQFRMVCMGFMAETIIRRLGKIHFKDDYFHLGMALFRRGIMKKVDSQSLRIEADKVLVFLMNKGRIELAGTEIRIAKQSFGAERVRMIGS
jgi:hypothetical protein